MRVLMEEQILEGNHDVLLMCYQHYNKNGDYADHIVAVPGNDELVFKFTFEQEWKVTVHKLERIKIE